MDSAAGTRVDPLAPCARERWLWYRSVPVVAQAHLSASVGGNSRSDSDTTRAAVSTMTGASVLRACPAGNTLVLGAALRTVSLAFTPPERGASVG